MHDGVWDKSADGAHEVRGRTLGIVGYGNIGTQLSVLAENLGMKVLFFDTADKLALGNARRCASRCTTCCARPTSSRCTSTAGPATRTCSARASSPRCARRSLFLNLSRGFVVDYAALRKHIESGHIAGAAVDVFPVEPKGRGDEFVSELRGLPNVILTPHIGGSTEEAQQDIGRFVAGKFRDFCCDGTTAMCVNLPGLALPQRPRHPAAHPHPPQRARRAGDRSTVCSPSTGQRRGAAARHPRRDRLRRDRHAPASPRRWSTRSARCRRRCGCGWSPSGVLVAVVAGRICSRGFHHVQMISDGDDR